MSDLKDFVIENGVLKKYVGQGSEVVIPDSVTSIGNSAFYNCKKLTAIVFPESLEYIGYKTFEFCDKLKKVVFNCKIVLDEDNKTYLQGALMNAPENVVFDLRKNSVNILKEFSKKALSLICFLENIENGVKYDEEIIKENFAYAKKQRKKLYDSALTNMILMKYLLTEKIVPLEDAMGLSSKMDSTQNIEIKAMLMAYIDSFGDNAQDKVVEKQEKKIEQELLTDPNSEAGLKMTWNFKKNPDGTLTLNSLKQESEVVVIPEKIGDLKVTALNDRCFKDKRKIKEVIIPDSIIKLGKKLFWKCDNLQKVVVGAGINSIEKGIFELCAAKEIILSDGLTSIGDYTFYDCQSLKHIEIPDGITYIGDFALSKCLSLQYNIEGGLKYLGNKLNRYLYLVGAESEKIKTAIVNDNCKFISSYAFCDCKLLTSVKLPNSITNISDSAFYDCSSLTNIEIPDSVTYIGSAAFSNCSSLTSIQLPNSITSIAMQAFWFCDALTDIEIPNSVTSIGNCAFYNCDSLTSVVIGDSLTSIGEDAFFGCEYLTIKATKGSYAEAYANKNSINFEEI